MRIMVVVLWWSDSGHCGIFAEDETGKFHKFKSVYKQNFCKTILCCLYTKTKFCLYVKLVRKLL